MKKRRQRKNCPECRYYNKKYRSCLKNPERETYLFLDLPDNLKEREWCPDMTEKRK